MNGDSEYKGKLLPKIRVSDIFTVDFCGKKRFDKIIFAKPTDDFHFTIGFYDKSEVFEIDMHQTSHDKKKIANGEKYTPLAKVYIPKDKLHAFTEKYGKALELERKAAIEASLKPISIYDIRKLGTMLMPLDREKWLLGSMGTKEIILKDLEDMKQKLGGPITSAEFVGTEKAAMLLADVRSSPNFLIYKNDQYFILNLFDLISKWPTFIQMVDELLIVEIYKDGITTRLKFSDMLKTISNN